MINYDRRVNVYFNLHKRLFSVTQGGIVKFHSDALTILDARFLVGKAGQAKVRKTGRKNVHAKVSGYIADYALADLALGLLDSEGYGTTYYQQKVWRKAYYNPYETDTFIDYADRIPLYKADVVRLEMANAVGRPSIMYANQEI
jgi:hypothetical protein